MGSSSHTGGVPSRTGTAFPRSRDATSACPGDRPVNEAADYFPSGQPGLSLSSAADPGSRLAHAVPLIILLLPRLEAAVVPGRGAVAQVPSPLPGIGSGPSSGTRPPWQAQVAAVALDIHYRSREHEATMRYVALGTLPSSRVRGPGLRSTAAALRALPALAAHRVFAGTGRSAAHDAASEATGWLNRASQVLGDTEPWRQLPRLPGMALPRCPFCRQPATLRMLPMRGLVRCISLLPLCSVMVRGREIRPLGTMTPVRDRATGDWRWDLVWSDGSTGVLPGNQPVAARASA